MATINVQVNASGNDGARWGSSNFASHYATAWLGVYYYEDRNIFALFNGITIPAGATIDSAYLSYYPEANGSGTPLTDIYGNDTGNPSAPTDADEYDSLALTSASVAWDGALTTGDWRNSPDIKTIIQELVDSYDYSGGGSIQLVHKTDPSSPNGDINEVRMYDYSGNNHGPKLHIEYTAGGATEKTSAETGAGVEVSSLSAGITKAESGGGVDTRASFLASLAKAESGSGVEQSLLSLSITSADEGAGIEGASSLLAELIKGDSGSGLEAVLGRALILSDSGSGVDALTTLLAVLPVGETGSGIDQSTLTSIVARLSSDTGSGVDAAEIIAGLISSETGLGADSGVIVGLKQLFSGDEGRCGDTLKALISISGSGSDMKLPGRQGRVGMPSKGVSL